MNIYTTKRIILLALCCYINASYASDTASVPSTVATGESSPLVNYGYLLTDKCLDIESKKVTLKELLAYWDEKSDVYSLELEPFVIDIIEQALEYNSDKTFHEAAELYCQLLGKLALQGSHELMSDIIVGILDAFDIEHLPLELKILRCYYHLSVVSSIKLPVEWSLKIFSENGVTTFLQFFYGIKTSLSVESREALFSLERKVEELQELCHLFEGRGFQLDRLFYRNIKGCLTSIRVVLWAWKNLYAHDSIPSELSFSSYDSIKVLCPYSLLDEIENVFFLNESKKK